MANRKNGFANNEYYHIYNRGVDKRNIFTEERDLKRFIQSILEFNQIKTIGSIYENSFNKSNKKTKSCKLVNFIAYCINPNHFHFILEQNQDDGIKKFMHKLSTGYTMYFNEKEKRSGPLFSGRYKAKHVDSDGYLLQLSAYVNQNDQIHQIGDSTSKLISSSLSQYININNNKYQPIPCDKEVIIEQFKNPQEYLRYSQEVAKETLKRRVMEDSVGLC
ncbi:MAG: Transposase [Candidatus Nomurabacteria bacterium GW2011_GWF2_35_66]|nr:MAG: Transposase [Candidatus Nomurabacteria bacterium GW2011_GWF2_35_66]HBM45418.1 hypothetical protein [Patescibacteria group bacterium]